MTVSLKLGEVAVDAALAKLKTHLPARIGQINAEKDDGLVIAAPSDADYYPFGVSEIPRYPTVVVTQLATSDEHEAEGAHSFIWVADIAVALFDADPDRGKLGRRLQRLARAAIEALWDEAPKEALQGSAFHLRFVRDDPGPVADPQLTGETFYVGSHLIVFRAQQSEG